VAATTVKRKPSRAGAQRGASTAVLETRPRLRKAQRSLPNALTLACLGLGFLAALAAGKGERDNALGLLAVAALADSLAGFSAQGWSLASDLGAELDSLAALMVWGVAPALLAYNNGLDTLGGWGLCLAGLTAVSAAWRLCRGDVQGGRDRYQGLPLPVAGLALVSAVAWPLPLNWIAGLIVALSAAQLSPWSWPRRPMSRLVAVPLLVSLACAAAGLSAAWLLPGVSAVVWAVLIPFQTRRS
jgi:CDP-diacylglycerol--serine O-phosphatidyltransferase